MLWLLRHAEALDGSPDESRPLSERGVEEAKAAGLALRRMGVKPDVCLSSPKLRARQTAELACEELGVEVTIAETLSGAPFDPTELAPGLDTVVLVGHDPALSLAVHDATGAQVRLRKGGLAGIQKGELVVLLTPTETHAIAYAKEQVG
jgi:phosphohistidine phosphatase